MRSTLRSFALLLMAGLFAAASVQAHENVANQAVKARMDTMSAIAAEMKTLGTMANGKLDFDQDKARAAAAEIAEHAALVPVLFKANEADPKSEARPEIWTNFEDFTAKSVSLETLAQEIASSDLEQSTLNQVVARFGAECKACHSEYRAE